MTICTLTHEHAHYNRNTSRQIDGTDVDEVVVSGGILRFRYSTQTYCSSSSLLQSPRGEDDIVDLEDPSLDWEIAVLPPQRVAKRSEWNRNEGEDEDAFQGKEGGGGDADDGIVMHCCRVLFVTCVADDGRGGGWAGESPWMHSSSSSATITSPRRTHRTTTSEPHDHHHTHHLLLDLIFTFDSAYLLEAFVSAFLLLLPVRHTGGRTSRPRRRHDHPEAGEGGKLSSSSPSSSAVMARTTPPFLMTQFPLMIEEGDHGRHRQWDEQRDEWLVECTANAVCQEVRRSQRQRDDEDHHNHIEKENAEPKQSSSAPSVEFIRNEEEKGEDPPSEDDADDNWEPSTIGMSNAAATTTDRAIHRWLHAPLTTRLSRRRQHRRTHAPNTDTLVGGDAVLSPSPLSTCAVTLSSSSSSSSSPLHRVMIDVVLVAENMNPCQMNVVELSRLWGRVTFRVACKLSNDAVVSVSTLLPWFATV